MAEQEFKVQVIETDAQWKSGLWSRLEFNSDGLTLFLNPVFESWFVSQKQGFVGGDIVVDECGQAYWTEQESEDVWTLFRHNPLTNQVERVLTFAGCGKINPRELWLDENYLWIFDQTAEGPTRKGRMLAFSRDNWQIILDFVIDDLIDLDFQPKGYFYALRKKDNGTHVCRYSTSTPPGKSECFTLKSSTTQVAVAANAEGIVYLLDAEQGRLIRFDPETKTETVLAAPQEKLLKGFKPSAMQIDRRGVLFLASNEPVGLHMFDQDGSYLEPPVELPSTITRIDGIGFDLSGGLLLSTDQGLAKFSLTKNPIGQEGVFYTRTLDNGQPESHWHRVALRGRIPAKSSLEVYYYASDDQAIKAAVDAAFAGTGSIEEKTQQLETVLGPRWIDPPETFKGIERPKAKAQTPGEAEQEQLENPDLILDPNKGRYLWVKFKLTTFDQKSRPSIRSLRIYYPRLSYLRYLPPLYREDTVSAAFLERFLSIFETSFSSLEQEVDQLFRYFDPSLTPREFLPWLASWINLSLDDDVPEQRVRQFIRRAASLYSRKGTARALVEFLEIYTGKSVYLTEYLHGLKPMVIGEGSSLGSGIVLLGSGPRGMTVGNTSVVGHSAIRDRVNDPDEPFLPLARRFTVVVDMDREEFERRKATLTRIVTEQAPAHTTFTLRSTSEQRTIGKAVLGVSTMVQDNRPYRVGLTQLGEGSAIAKGPRVLRLERGAWAGSSGRV